MGRPALTAPGSQPAARGRFVTFEGGEGAGKSTQTALLVAALARAGIAARQTREPGGSEGAEAIRGLLLEGGDQRWDAVAEALLMNAARRDHLVRTILPSLAEGVWVISDRFAESTLAYQGYGRGLPLDKLRILQCITLGNFTPDLTLVLDLPAAEGLARVARRAQAGDRFERLEPAFHERLRRGFLEIAAGDPGRCVVIDAARDRHAVHRAVVAAVAGRLGTVLAA